MDVCVWACGSYLVMEMVYGRRCSSGIGGTAESGLGLNVMDAGFLLREGSEQMGLRQQCMIVFVVEENGVFIQRGLLGFGMRCTKRFANRAPNMSF